jgi:hypothetical protein
MSVFDRLCKIIGLVMNGSSAKKITNITNVVGILHRSSFVKTLPLCGRVLIKKPCAVKCSLPHLRKELRNK